MSSPTDILAFWFGRASEDPSEAERRNTFWYGVSTRRDREITQRFGAALEQARRGLLDDWAASPSGGLALVLLLDQFSRNIHRGTAAAFAQDARALALARAGVDTGSFKRLTEVERSFLYLPYQHAEDTVIQRQSIQLYKNLLADSRPEFRAYVERCLQHAREHLAVIDRFGRFPHRNEILDRDSTDAEKLYLISGARTYGQVAGR